MLSQDITELLLTVIMSQLVSILSYRFVLWVEGNIQMCPHCWLKIAYCYGPRTWIFGRTPWTEADQTFTVRTSLLTGHDTDAGVEITRGAGHPRSSPAASVVVSFNREDVSGQSTDQTMRHYVMLLCVLDGTDMPWRPADWPSTGAFQTASSGRPCDKYRPVNSVRAVEQCTHETCMGARYCPISRCLDNCKVANSAINIAILP